MRSVSSIQRCMSVVCWSRTGAAVVACGGSDNQSGPDAKVFDRRPPRQSAVAAARQRAQGQRPDRASVMALHAVPGSDASHQGTVLRATCGQCNLNGWCTTQPGARRLHAGSGDICNPRYTRARRCACIVHDLGINGTERYCGIICALTAAARHARTRDTCPALLHVHATSLIVQAASARNADATTASAPIACSIVASPAARTSAASSRCTRRGHSGPP